MDGGALRREEAAATGEEDGAPRGGRGMRRHLTDAQKRIVAARARWHCEACGAMLQASWQCDHIVPLWEGGADSIDQCQALCANCHARKTQEEAIRRAARKRRLREQAALLRHGGPPPRRRSPLECTGCGVVFSPYFAHTCGNDRSPG